MTKTAGWVTTKRPIASAQMVLLQPIEAGAGDATATISPRGNSKWLKQGGTECKKVGLDGEGRLKKSLPRGVLVPADEAPGDATADHLCCAGQAAEQLVLLVLSYYCQGLLVMVTVTAGNGQCGGGTQ